MKKCFFAYPNDVILSETIKRVEASINVSSELKLITWEKLHVDGKIIIDKIIKEIDECDFFLCELTDLNNNVLYELGYAIAKKKAIQLFINSNSELSMKKLTNFDLLTSVGYTPYTDSNSIISKIWGMQTDTGFSENPLIEKFTPSVSSVNCSNLFLLKNCHETAASIRLTNIIKEKNLKHIFIDDPTEVPNQTLEWYITKLIDSNSCLIHFISDEQENNKMYNSKYSFIAGMAYGLNISLLLIAEDKFSSPLDYKDQIVKYRNKNECEISFNTWYEINKDEITHSNSIAPNTQKEIKAIANLKNINLGENISENEQDSLKQYFIETSSFYDALNYNMLIFIGRKGTGKTANLYNIAEKYDNNKNLVCVIKPIGYELTGVLDILKKLDRYKQGYLIESIWKYLIYSEILKSIKNKIDSRPIHIQKTYEENEILDFIEINKDIILPDFSTRLENIILKLSDINSDQQKSAQDFQSTISQLLHENIIGKFRAKIGDYCEKMKTVKILIDNLDKAWKASADIEILSRFLFGLLDVGNNIIKDFSKENQWKRPVNLSLIIFLREDIFTLMKNYIPERDKIQITRIMWEDNVLLLRVIEERIKNSIDQDVDVWENFFCKKVDNDDVKHFIISHILPLPRDIITLIKYALSNAINRKHTVIDESDLIDALTTYSKFALDTLITELSPQYNQISDFLYSLEGSSQIIMRQEIDACMDLFIPSADRELFISLLCKMSFLGLEIREDQFEFCYSEEHYIKYSALSNKYIRLNNLSISRYKIHPAFYDELMLEF